MSSKIPQHIIAIGASAGGMEELNLFFDHTPLDGVSYIIIQHQSPDFKSFMVELLAKHSKLLVRQAQEGMEVLTNQVYLIPNNKLMTIKQGHLYLSDKTLGKIPNLTIDHFLISLAQDAGSSAIAIILSGMGKDGTLGIKAIKEEGGMVIVRNPKNSQFDNMPKSAIQTGCADFIADPEKMPAIIEDYLQFGITVPEKDSNEIMNLDIFLKLVKKETNLDFSEYKTATLKRRIKKRIEQLGLKSMAVYLDYLKSNISEAELLAKDFLINVTSFFRDPEAFELLENKVIPNLIEQLNQDEELKLWVAGCATGEEVYSLAILFWEALEKKSKEIKFKIFATDIDSDALYFAGKGLYTNTISHKINPIRLKKFFNKEDLGYRIKPELRKLLIFARHDLVKNPPYCNMHFISCRNILIYMTTALQKKVFGMLLFGLKKEGYLFLGTSENPMPILENLEIINQKYKIYKNISNHHLLGFDTFSIPEFSDFKKPIYPLQGIKHTQDMDTIIEKMYDNVLQGSGSLTLCVDENKNVIKSLGNTSRFLKPKNFTTFLPDILPKALLTAFNSVSLESSISKKISTVKGIRFNHLGKTTLVNISVCPLILNIHHPFQQVIFTEESLLNRSDIELEAKEFSISDTYTRNLEKEVGELRQKLRWLNEQLDSSNENLQSYNEELLSANEEMQTVNEELETINSSFQEKNKELQELNDDLNNYFRSNINAQIFVNKNLELLRYSSISTELINLRESDIGRPIHHISHNFKSENISSMIKKVLEDQKVLRDEMETVNGFWFQIIAMPYIQSSDSTCKGVIVTFIDISQLKSFQLEIEKKNKKLLRVNANLDNFVITASHDLLAPLSNIEMSINIMNLLEIKDQELVRFLDIINISAKKFRLLIKDMATIAKLEDENKNIEAVNIDETLQNIEWSLQTIINQTKTTIKKDLKVEELIFSKKNLRSILFNLISNGIKFKNKKSPRILVKSYIEQEFVVISIKDNGMGMEDIAYKRIFDIYGRLHTEVEGQGIGLYLAQKIVNASGGYIKVESEFEIGTTFFVYLKQIPDVYE